MLGKILITGGCGFIGKSLAHALLQRRFEVVVVDKNTAKIGNVLDGALVIEGDVCNKEMWRTIPSCDYIFHLAAPSSVILFDTDMDNCIQNTTVGLMHAFAWARNNNVKKLIYPSSGSIFGKNNADCTEETIPEPVNSYGKTKLICEYIGKTYTDVVPNLGLRIFAGYGPQEDQKGAIASVVTLFIKDMLAGISPTIFGDGSQTRDFVYIDDIVDIMLLVMNNQTEGVLNVGSGMSTSFSQVVALINNQLGTHIAPTYISKPKKYLEKTACNPARLRQLLGRKTITLDQGIRSYLKLMGEL